MGLGGPTAITRFDYSVNSRLSLMKQYYDFSGKKVLDLGCANGVYTAEISKIACSVLGIELNENYLQDAIRLKNDNNIENLEFKCCKIEDLDCEEKFDAVIMIEVLEHVSDEDAILQKIGACLKDDGYFILFSPNKLYPFETHGMSLFGKNVNFKGSVPFLSWAPGFIRRYFLDVRIYTRWGLRKLLKNNGFDILVFDYFLPPLDRINAKTAEPLRKLLKIVDCTPLKIFGISIFCIAKKSDLPVDA